MRRRLVRLVLVAVGAFLVLVGAAAAFVFWQAEGIVGEFQAGAKREVVDAARPELDVDPRRPVESPSASSTKARTILLLGSDHRFGDPTRNSDTMLLLPSTRRSTAPPCCRCRATSTWRSRDTGTRA